MTTIDFFLTHCTDNLTLLLTMWFLSCNLLLIRETEGAFQKRVEMMSHDKTSAPDDLRREHVAAPNSAIHFIRLHQRAMLSLTAADLEKTPEHLQPSCWKLHD